MLNGTLFIDRENSRVNWRVEVETDDIGGLGLKVRIVAGHISPEAMGLKTSLAPDLRDVRLGRSQLSARPRVLHWVAPPLGLRCRVQSMILLRVSRGPAWADGPGAGCRVQPVDPPGNGPSTNARY